MKMTVQTACYRRCRYQDRQESERDDKLHGTIADTITVHKREKQALIKASYDRCRNAPANHPAFCCQWCADKRDARTVLDNLIDDLTKPLVARWDEAGLLTSRNALVIVKWCSAVARPGTVASLHPAESTASQSRLSHHARSSSASSSHPCPRGRRVRSDCSHRKQSDAYAQPGRGAHNSDGARAVNNGRSGVGNFGEHTKPVG
jgi:hypothetical protein